ncbi:acylphosphatase [Xylariomycetidae sp. FL2044]|nr:acylphosphatase [Xylariomycetidae sp. FL2044]
MSQRIYFLVHGQVQGVNFRYFTRTKAQELNVTGWCRNTPNDQVEGEAQGDEDSIRAFTRHLDKGPPAAQVTKLDKEDRDVKEGETSFEVRR